MNLKDLKKAKSYFTKTTELSKNYGIAFLALNVHVISKNIMKH